MSSDFPKDHEFLLPANPGFIAFSFFVAIMLNWLPWNGWGLILRPDFVALVLLYWCTHKPYRVGIGIAWMVGILTDVADASLFGQHALAYSVLAFGGTVLHRRIQMFDLKQQTIQIFPLLLISYATYAAVHWQVRGIIVWEYFFGCIVSAAMWIPMTLLLQTLRHPRSDPNEL
jgi:rod shape-determining protein MreD